MLLLSLNFSQSNAVLSRTVILGRLVSLLTRVPSLEVVLGLFTPLWGSVEPESVAATSEEVDSEGVEEDTSESLLFVRVMQGADSRRLFLINENR